MHEYTFIVLFQYNSPEKIFWGGGSLDIIQRKEAGRGGREHVILVMSGIHLSPPNHAVLFIPAVCTVEWKFGLFECVVSI